MRMYDTSEMKPGKTYYEVTFVEFGLTKILTRAEAVAEFGREEFNEILQGYLPQIVAVKL